MKKLSAVSNFEMMITLFSGPTISNSGRKRDRPYLFDSVTFLGLAS